MNKEKKIKELQKVIDDAQRKINEIENPPRFIVENNSILDTKPDGFTYSFGAPVVSFPETLERVADILNEEEAKYQKKVQDLEAQVALLKGEITTLKFLKNGNDKDCTGPFVPVDPNDPYFPRPDYPCWPKWTCSDDNNDKDFKYTFIPAERKVND